MKTLSDIRSNIYDHFHATPSCQSHFFVEDMRDEYAAYYTAMYLLQDTIESLWEHKDRGFSTNSLMAYIEFWGVMQAVFIQQDSIKELHRVVAGGELDTSKSINWKELRKLRNVCSGHPVNQGGTGNRQRSFMGRNFGNYDRITIEVWQEKNNQIVHNHVKLGNLIDSYASEAAVHMQDILTSMEAKWPKGT